jgi:hypothetical protein
MSLDSLLQQASLVVRIVLYSICVPEVLACPDF